MQSVFDNQIEVFNSQFFYCLWDRYHSFRIYGYKARFGQTKIFKININSEYLSVLEIIC